MFKENFTKLSFLNTMEFAEGYHANVYAKSVKSIPIQMSDGVILIYVIEGDINIKISFNKYSLNKGDFLLINKYEVYGIESANEKNSILFVELDCNYMFEEEEYFFAFDPHFYREYNMEHVQRVIKSMINLYLTKDEKAFFKIQEKELNIINDMCINYFQIQNFDPVNKFESPLITSDVKLERIGNTFKYFYQNHQEKIKLDQVAEREFIDKFYASHLIKSGTGSSFFEMLNIVRIDRAEVMLLGTSKSIDKISDEAGFSSYQYFSQSFKQFFKLSPSAYRKAFKKETYPNKQAVFYEHDENKTKRKVCNNYGLTDFSVSEKIIEYEQKNEILNILKEAGFLDREGINLEGIQQIIFKFNKN